MRVNSITTSNQASKFTDREKDKNKDKFQPIMPYYIITNRLYSSHYNSPMNQKSFLHKKNYINHLKDINVNTKNNNKKIIKSNSTLTSYNNLNYNHYSKQNLYSNKHNKNEINSFDQSPSIKDKILSKSKKHLKNDNKVRGKKKFNFDCNLLIKKISNNNKQKSMHDIFYNDNNNCYTLNNSEAMKKNKKMIMTSLNNSKNSSQEKAKKHSKKKIHKFNYLASLNKMNWQEKNNVSKKLSLNNSSKIMNNKVVNTFSNKNGKLNKKSHAKFLNSELFHPDNKKQRLNFFMNYLKGANNIVTNNNSCKSMNSTGNVTYKKPQIKIGMSELKKELIKENNYIFGSIPSTNKNITNQNSSIKMNNYNQNQKQNTARSLSMNTKNEKKNNDFLNIYHFNSTNKHSKKNSLNTTKVNLKKFLAQCGDSPFYKYCHKTIGNNLPNNKNIKNYKTIKSPYNYNNKHCKKINSGINPVNNKKSAKNDNYNYNCMNNYSYKANKILKESLKEISKIKNDFAKYFTSNNSPNHKNNLNNKKDVDNNNNNNNGNITNNNSIQKNMNKYSFIKKKKHSKHSSIKKDCIPKIKQSPKK